MFLSTSFSLSLFFQSNLTTRESQYLEGVVHLAIDVRHKLSSHDRDWARRWKGKGK